MLPTEVHHHRGGISIRVMPDPCIVIGHRLDFCFPIRFLGKEFPPAAFHLKKKALSVTGKPAGTAPGQPAAFFDDGNGQEFSEEPYQDILSIHA